MEVAAVDVVKLQQRVERLEAELAGFRTSIHSYIRAESLAQESADVEKVLEKIHTFMPALLTKRGDIREFYMPSGRLLTDIDGCILLRMKPSPPKPRAGYRNNSLGFNPAVDFERTIFIESKHSLTKTKIDDKLRQMVVIKQILQELPSIDISTAATPFRSMVTEHKVDKYPNDICIVFSANDLDASIRNFLVQLNEDLTKEYYDRFTIHLMKTNPVYGRLRKDSHVPRKAKIALHAAKTVEEALIQLESIGAPYSFAFSSFLVPYDTILPIYAQLKHRIGFLQWNKLYLPEMFPLSFTNGVTALNTLHLSV